MSESRFPAGWDEQRVERLIAELDARTEEEWVTDYEASASEGDDQTVVTVPTVLLPEIRRLLASHKSERDERERGSRAVPILQGLRGHVRILGVS